MRASPRFLAPTLFAIVLAALCSAPATISARTWHTLSDGSGDAPTIQAGIDSAAVGDTVLLGDGTFAGVGNRDLDLHGKAIVIRSESGNAEACVIDCEGSEGDPHRAFFLHSGESAGAALEAFKILNGFAPGEIPLGLGGGILCDSGSAPTIRGCIFEGNTAWIGGGICWAGGSSGQMLDCVLRGNTSQAGGGLASRQSAPTIDGCVFSENRSRFFGGSGDCWGGAADFWESPSLISHCVFERNTAGDPPYPGAGGGVSLYEPGSIRFTECRFTENAGSLGGGMFVYRTYTAPEVHLAGCVFDGNEADHGGGLYSWMATSWPGEYDRVYVDSCTFFDNGATSGSGIYELDSPTWASSTIISFGRGSSAVFSATGIQPCGHFTCCDIFGNEGGDWVGCIADQSTLQGNFSADPLFCDSEAGDLTLDAGSPCLNAPGCGLVGALGGGCAVTGIASPGGPVSRAETRFVVTPNPGKGAFAIQFGMPSAPHTTIHVFDIAGRLVRVLGAPAAQGSVVWDGKDAGGRDVSPGVYFVRVSDRAHTETRRVLLVR